jgi:hypothetical protein
MGADPGKMTMNIEHAKRVLKHQQEQQLLISTAFPGRYLKSEDLMGEIMTVTIKGLAMEQVSRSGDPQPVLYFKEFQKGLVLNKTNSKTIAKAHGDETNHWRGRQVDLYEAMVEYQGDVMPAIRMRVKPAVAEMPILPPSILIEGKAMAEQGLAKLRAWRDGLSATEMDSIRPDIEELLAIARQTDAKLAPVETKKAKKSGDGAQDKDAAKPSLGGE